MFATGVIPMADIIAYTLFAGGLLVVLPTCYQLVRMQDAKPSPSDRTLTRLHEHPTDLTVTDHRRN
jgi:hypothetical protein